MTDLTTIRGLRDALAELPDQGARIFIGECYPTALSSYRGFYDQLAIERDGSQHDRTELTGRREPFELNMAGYGTYAPGHREVRIKNRATVADLVEALDLADGEVFEGYKGGQFRMSGGTSLWVSEYGECDRLRVDRISVATGRVHLITVKDEAEDWW